jgi:hypothetical protein
MCCKNWKNSLMWTLGVAAALGAGAIAFAQDNQQGGRIVRIAPDDRTTIEVPTPGGEIVRDDRPVAPSHWIGLTGGPVTPELRAHVEIPADQGILVRDIVPNSPAAKAGLKQFDILLVGNDAQLRDMTDLVGLVRAEGPKNGQITLEVLRKGQRQSLTVKPEERPEDAAARVPGGAEQGQFGQMPGLGDMPEFRQFFRNFGDGAGAMEFRQFGPGVVFGQGGALGQGGGLANMPNGVSISIQKQNDQPAHITVKRGGQTWEIVGDDPESLKQLPDDLRPFVERTLHGTATNGLNLNFDGGPNFGPQGDGPGFDERGLRLRLERMERQMQQLLERMPNDNRPAEERGK